MKLDPSQLLLQALELPDAERAALAAKLLQSLDREVDEDAEQAWSEEIARRLRQIDNGEVELVPWEAVRAELRQRLDERSST